MYQGKFEVASEELLYREKHLLHFQVSMAIY